MNFENSTRTVPFFVVYEIFAVSCFTSLFIVSSVFSALNAERIF
jgi:hypothetical protein